MKQKTIIFPFVLLVSLSAFLFLIWIIYGEKTPGITLPFFLKKLPLLNCCFNTASTLCILTGIKLIKKRAFIPHAICMISALCFSILFFISYSIYHYYLGDKIFLGTGLIRFIYFFILISHILLTIVTIPMILWTFILAGTNSWKQHRFWAKKTYPFWLYISITGVLIYFFLYVW